MRISTKLRVAAMVPAAMALATIVGLLFAYSPVVELQRRQSDIIQIRTDLNTLDDLARSYVVNHDARSRSQFFIQVDDTLQEVERASSAKAIDRRSLAPVDQNLRIMRSLFVRIVENHEASRGQSSRELTEAEQRLSAQLLIRSTGSSDIAAQVVRTLSAEIVMLQQRVSVLVTVFTTIAAAILTVGALMLRRGITRSLNAIGTGTVAIGGGDLDYRIGLKTRDELGDLGRSFDTMTERLRGVTVSKTEIETEVHERRRAEEELRQSLATTQVLLEAADALSSSIAAEDVLKSLARVLSRATGRRRVLISLYDEESDTIVTATDTSGIVPEGSRFSIGALAPAVRAAIDERQPRVIDYDSTERAPLNRQRAVAFGYRLALVVPLVRGDRALGYFSIDDPGERRDFSEREVEVARGIAAQAAVALENARLYETERGVADHLQGALLALPEELPGLEFAHAYHSAAEAARVGGDFYDLFPLTDNAVGITIGDVAGKGLDAAVLTSLTKNTIRAHANERGKTPPQILALTNDVVYKSTPVESFVTVFFGVLDLGNGGLSYTNAGHTSAIILGSDGSTQTLPATGPIIGAFPEVELGESSTRRLQGDEMLFLYTDGLTEARHDRTFFGEERLLELLGGLRDRKPAEIVRAVIDEVLRFTGGRLDDDLALLAVRLLGGPTQRGERLEM